MKQDAVEQTLLATNDIGVVATLGFFVPAMILVVLVVTMIWRDRRAGERSRQNSQERAPVDHPPA